VGGREGLVLVCVVAMSVLFSCGDEATVDPECVGQHVSAACCWKAVGNSRSGGC